MHKPRPGGFGKPWRLVRLVNKEGDRRSIDAHTYFFFPKILRKKRCSNAQKNLNCPNKAP